MTIPLLRALLLGSALLTTPAVWAVDALVGDSNFIFDPQDTGYLSNGLNDAYDSSYYLTINGTGFPVVSAVLSKDKRTVRYPLTALGNGLSASRSFFVPAKDKSPTADYGRYLDCVKNTSDLAMQNIDVNIWGNLGSDNTTGFYASSDGNTVLDANDTWFSTDDGGGDPSLAHIMGKNVVNPSLSLVPTLSDAADTISWHFTLANLEPAQTACVLTYAVQATNQASAQALAKQLASKPDLTGLDSATKISVQNYDLLDYATVAVFPASGDALDTASFDANIVLKGSSKALQNAKLSILLNGTDIASSCTGQQALLNADKSTVIGRVLDCPSISSLLNKSAKNDLVVTHTSVSGGKTINKTSWSLHTTQALTP